MSRVGPPALIVGLMLAASACKIMPENPYRTAAEQGNLNAQYLLGRMYERGQGVAKDDVLAYVWLSAAAEQGSAEAAHGMDSAAARLTPEQLAEARMLASARRVKAWQAGP